MSEEYQKYEVGEPVVYTNGDKVELGVVKKVCGDDEYFVNYHTGDTAARTHARHLSKISNQYAFHVARLDPDGNERLMNGLAALERYCIYPNANDYEIIKKNEITQDEFDLLKEILK